MWSWLPGPSSTLKPFQRDTRHGWSFKSIHCANQWGYSVDYRVHSLLGHKHPAIREDAASERKQKQQWTKTKNLTRIRRGCCLILPLVKTIIVFACVLINQMNPLVSLWSDQKLICGLDKFTTANAVNVIIVQVPATIKETLCPSNVSWCQTQSSIVYLIWSNMDLNEPRVLWVPAVKNNYIPHVMP